MKKLAPLLLLLILNTLAAAQIQINLQLEGGMSNKVYADAGAVQINLTWSGTVPIVNQMRPAPFFYIFFYNDSLQQIAQFSLPIGRLAGSGTLLWSNPVNQYLSFVGDAMLPTANPDGFYALAHTPGVATGGSNPPGGGGGTPTPTPTPPPTPTPTPATPTPTPTPTPPTATVKLQSVDLNNAKRTMYGDAYNSVWTLQYFKKRSELTQRTVHSENGSAVLGSWNQSNGTYYAWQPEKRSSDGSLWAAFSPADNLRSQETLSISSAGNLVASDTMLILPTPVVTGVNISDGITITDPNYTFGLAGQKFYPVSISTAYVYTGPAQSSLPAHAIVVGQAFKAPDKNASSDNNWDFNILTIDGGNPLPNGVYTLELWADYSDALSGQNPVRLFQATFAVELPMDFRSDLNVGN